MNRLLVGTICSGIGAPEHALADRYNFLFCSEIEKFPSDVLKYHYPTVPNLGDITQVSWEQWQGKIDLLIGGPPCQAFSIAGERASLDDPRAALTLKYVQILKTLKPALAVYENVPGILNAKQNPWGKFLGAVIGSDELQAPLGKWKRAGMVAGKFVSVAWRVLNAKHFGLAQNRSRIYAVIADSRKLGKLVGAPSWFDSRRLLSVSGQICFESASGNRDFTPERKPRQKAAPNTSDRVEFPLKHFDTLKQGHGGGENRIDGIGCYIPAVVGFSSIDYGNGAATNLSPTLRAGKCGNSTAVAFPAVGFSKVDGGGDAREECAPTLRAGNFVESHISGSANGVSVAHLPGLNWEVRRLTPIECERLMGFSDDYTNIPWRGKTHSPGSLRYRALGNSMAVPCLTYIADCIDNVLLQYQDFFNQPDALSTYLAGLQVEAKKLTEKAL